MHIAKSFTYLIHKIFIFIILYLFLLSFIYFTFSSNMPAHDVFQKEGLVININDQILTKFIYRSIIHWNQITNCLLTEEKM